MWIVRSVLNQKNIIYRRRLYSDKIISEIQNLKPLQNVQTEKSVKPKKPESRIYQFGEFMTKIDPSLTQVFLSPKLVNFDGFLINSISSCWLSTYFSTRPEGMVFCWGSNDVFYPGIPHIRDSRIYNPIFVYPMGTVKVVQVCTGRLHILYRTSEKKLIAIGNNEFGQLGDGEMVNKTVTTHQKVETLNNVVDIATGLDHNLALTEDGSVYSWGFNREGQLGLGQDTEDVPKPTKVQGIEKKVVRVFCGLDYSYALTETGEFYGWGNGELLQLGNMEQDIKLVPMLVSIEGEKIIDMSPAGISALALTESGSVFSWGKGISGRLGHGDDKDQFVPKKIAFFSDAGKRIVQIAGRGGHHLALSEDGALYSWGVGGSGRLGHGDETDRFEPTRITFFDDMKISRIACGLEHSLVITDE